MSPPYVIAEVDANHGGEPDTARRLIDVARAAGATAVKFQKRTVAQAMVRQALDQRVRGMARLGRTMREVLERLELPVDVLVELRAYARPDLDFILAPYDTSALHAAEFVDPVALFVESALVTHRPLLEAIGNRRLPAYASTTGCSPRELASLGAALARAVLLSPTLVLCDSGRCVASVGRTGLRPVVAARLTLDRRAEGPGHAGSLTPDEFSNLVAAVRGADVLERAEPVGALTPEEADRLAEECPSLVAAQRIAAGTILTRDMLDIKAPMRGLSPEFIEQVQGRRTLYDLEPDDFITFGVLAP